MIQRRFHLVRTGPADPNLVSLETVAHLSGLHPGMVEEFARANLVPSVIHRSEMCFDEAGLYRLRQIHALYFGSGVSMRTVRLILALVDRLELAEKELRRLREHAR